MLAAINSSSLVEFILGIIAIVGAIASFSFYLASLKLVAKFQRLIDRNTTLIGTVEMRTANLEDWASAKHGFIIRRGFLPEYLPEDRTDL